MTLWTGATPEVQGMIYARIPESIMENNYRIVSAGIDGVCNAPKHRCDDHR